MRTKKTLLFGFLLLSLMCTISAKAQQIITVNGTITDSENGGPLPGVNVIVQGTTNGAIADFDGNYTKLLKYIKNF